MNVILCSDASLVFVFGSQGAHLVFLFPRESLERTRLKFSLQGGKVRALCPQEGEQVWALNIKRAVLSMLQTSHTAYKKVFEKEVSAYHIFKKSDCIFFLQTDMNCIM